MTTSIKTIVKCVVCLSNIKINRDTWNAMSDQAKAAVRCDACGTAPAKKDHTLSKRMFALGWRLFNTGDHIECHGPLDIVFTFSKTTKAWIGLAPEPYVELEEAFKRFDWTYDYSDDGRVWSAGQAMETNIKRMCATLELSTDQINVFNRKYNSDEADQFDIRL